jgi:hypothetical protein
MASPINPFILINKSLYPYEQNSLYTLSNYFLSYTQIIGQWPTPNGNPDVVIFFIRCLADMYYIINSWYVLTLLQWYISKYIARSKLFYFIIYRSSMPRWSSRTLTKLNSQSQKRFNERKYQYLKYKNKNHSGPDTFKFTEKLKKFSGSFQPFVLIRKNL